MDITTLSACDALQAAGADEPGSVLFDAVEVDLDGVVVVRVRGDIDLYTGPLLRRVLEDLLPPVPSERGVRSGAGDQDRCRGGHPTCVRAVVVDLTEVDFADSFALGVLVHGHRLARPGRRAYALVATGEVIRMLFNLTGLSKVLPLHPNLVAALRVLHPAGHDASTS